MFADSKNRTIANYDRHNLQSRVVSSSQSVKRQRFFWPVSALLTDAPE